MPKGGPRPGAGRPFGPNKTTVQKRIALGVKDRIKEMERDARTALSTAESPKAPPADRNYAIDVMAKYMTFFDGLASHYSPRPPGVEQNPHYKEPEFRYYSNRTLRWCNALARFQSPTLRAVAHMLPSVHAPEQTGPVIDGDNIVRIGDFTASSRVYENMLKTGKRTSGGRG